MDILSCKKWILLAFLAALSAACVSAQPYAYVSSFGNNVSIVTPTGAVAGVINLAGTASGIVPTPDGNYLFVACQGSNSVRVISLATNTVVNNIATGSLPVQLGITPNGAQVYALDRGSLQISVINVASQTLTTNISVASKPMQVAFSADGSRAYVALYAGNVAVIDTASNTVVGNYTAAYGMSSIAVAKGLVYAANQTAGTVAVYDGSGNVVTTISGLPSPSWLAATPDGSRIFATNGNGTVSVINTGSNSLIAAIAVGSLPTSVAVSADGAYAYVTNEYSNNVSQISTATNTVVRTSARVGPYPYSIATSPAGGPPPPPLCTFTLSQTSASFPAAGGTGSVTVTPSASCGSWTAASNVGWASIMSSAGPSATSFSGTGTVSYSVNPDLSSLGQSGTLTIAGQTFTITQVGLPCTYTLSANSASFPATGGTGVVNVTAPAGCGWSAGSNVAWAQVTGGASGSGSGGISYSVNANNSSVAAGGTLTIAGQNYTLSESGVGCTYSLSSTSGMFAPTGGSATINVTAPAGCGWTASSGVAWSQITAGASGSGSGSVSYKVSPNAGGASLSGSLTIAGLNYSITEAGASCSFSLSALSNSFPSTGGAGTVNVTAPSGCGWAATSGVAWTQITGGASGSGNGTVSYSVNPNQGNTGLSGVLTIAGQTYAITEAGVACTFTLSASSASLSFAAGAGSVNVTANGSCGWTGTSDSAWLTVTAGFSGSGNGTVSFSTTANPGSGSRTGNVTVGDQNFAVTQAGTSFSPIRIHAGGPEVTDSLGNVWAADNATNTSKTTTAINGTTDQALYQTEAWSTGPLIYRFAVPNGSHTVTLKFAEFYIMARGLREFDILLNNLPYDLNVDIFRAVGANTAYDLVYPVNVTDGQITIQLRPLTGSSAKIDAIQID